MSDQRKYLKEDLEKILSSCIAMATLDGEIDAHELGPVVSFVENNWQAVYGDINNIVASAQDNASLILKSDSMKESLRSMATSLAGSLDEHQKQSVLSLLANVLHADGEAHEMEHGLYNVFAKQFQS